MAAGRLPSPGTEYGPCEDCVHTDCAATREQARAVCHLCAELIGYETRYYTDEDKQGERALVHADCLEDSLVEFSKRDIYGFGE